MKLGGLGDCHCESGETDIKVPLSRSGPIEIDVKPAAPAVQKPRKPRSKGKGSHCVVSHKGKVVHCYESKETAERVAHAFTKKGQAHTKFTVRNRKD